MSQSSRQAIKFTNKYLEIPQDLVCENLKVFKEKLTDYNSSNSPNAIIGSIIQEEGIIRFMPIVPFEPNTDYTLVCNTHEFFNFKIDQPKNQIPLEVKALYPNTDEVPNNILKWYVRFSKPVNPVKIYDHIQFLDANGKAIDRAILDIKSSLLSSDGTLLTVWVEPGRQKRLLGPNKHLGSVFEIGNNYSLVIDASLKDMNGYPMGQSFSHRFMTSEEDRNKPSIDKWLIDPVHSDSRDPLIVHFEEAVDFGSLLDAFYVLKNKQVIEGVLDLDQKDKMIYFTPKQPWSSGNYTIEILAQLEDLAGNNLLHLFDRPLDEALNKTPSPSFKLRFESQ